MGEARWQKKHSLVVVLKFTIPKNLLLRVKATFAKLDIKIKGITHPLNRKRFPGDKECPNTEY